MIGHGTPEKEHKLKESMLCSFQAFAGTDARLCVCLENMNSVPKFASAFYMLAFIVDGSSNPRAEQVWLR